MNITNIFVHIFFSTGCHLPLSIHSHLFSSPLNHVTCLFCLSAYYTILIDYNALTKTINLHVKGNGWTSDKTKRSNKDNKDSIKAKGKVRSLFIYLLFLPWCDAIVMWCDKSFFVASWFYFGDNAEVIWVWVRVKSTPEILHDSRTAIFIFFMKLIYHLL